MTELIRLQDMSYLNCKPHSFFDTFMIIALYIQMYLTPTCLTFTEYLKDK